MRRKFWLMPFEALAFLGQYLYMRPKMTNEKVGWGRAFFHPRNLSNEVLKKFETRLRVKKDQDNKDKEVGRI